MKKFNKFSLLLTTLLFTALFTVSCSDDDDENPPFIPPAEATPQVIVVNEGGMGAGLSDLSVLYSDGNIVNDPFRKANNNRPLGDVAQYMTCINGKYFVTLNNSKKIEVIDTATFASVATIVFNEDTKPRYISILSDSTAAVSDLNPQIIIINTKTYKVVEYIPLKGRTTYEQMLTVGNKLFCANLYDGGVDVYNTNDLKQVRKNISANGVSACKTAPLVLDRNGNIWVYCAGRDDNFDNKKVFMAFNPDSEEVIAEIALPDSIKTTDYTRIDVDGKKDKIYFDGYVEAPNSWTPAVKYIYTLDIDTQKFASYLPLRGTEMIYGMNVDAEGNAWVCDCLDYTRQRGYLRQYLKNGNVMSWQVGIYPNLAYFPGKSN